MKMSDIPDEFFEDLIDKAKALDVLSTDIMVFHNINITQERKAVFPSINELNKNRHENIELTQQQWYDYWKVIEKQEVSKAMARVFNARENAEITRLNIENPVQYDEYGAYRLSEPDWDSGRREKMYLEMGN